MDALNLLDGLAAATAQAVPVALAAVGETVGERAGVVNLSLNGTIILSAFTAFAAARATGSLAAGFLAGALVGAASGALAAWLGDFLRRSPLAAGLVLAFLFKDVAYFVGAPLLGQTGPQVPGWPVQGLCDLPGVGPVLFRHDLVTYAGYGLILLASGWLLHTRPGLAVRCVGENPRAAHARGIRVRRVRLFAALAGGALAGLAGPAYSLCLKPGWKGPLSGLDGIGWIALALTVFGGWHPVRALAGAWVFAFVQWLGIALQPSLSGFPSQVFSVIPFPLMIGMMVLVNLAGSDALLRFSRRLPGPTRGLCRRLGRMTHWQPPAGLGRSFRPE